MPLFGNARVSGHLGLLCFPLLILMTSAQVDAASWTRLTNLAPSGAGVMLQLTDGTIMVQAGATQNWMRLTPDPLGSYVNGVWTANPISPMSTPRLYFASVVLPSAKVWVLGGEYTGPFLDANWSETGEIFDPVTNSWSPIAPYPPQTGCPQVTVTSPANITAGSPIITGILSTAGFQIGRGVTGTGIPTGTIIVSVDSPTQVHVSQNATLTGNSTLRFANVARSACFGDDPAILLSGGQILTGNLTNRSTYIYDVEGDTWTFAANKFYADQSDEESWVKLPDGSVLTYDISRSNATGSGLAELYNPRTNTWASISPVDGSAGGFLPLLSSNTLGSELGPELRLNDGRIFVVGANGHTALYSPNVNTWAAGPDITGRVNGNTVLFGADDAPGAIVPNGHVLLAADAGPQLITSPGNFIAGSNIITGLSSTALLQIGLMVRGTGIPSGALIVSVDSSTQVRISSNATATATGVTVTFGGTFSPPTQIFEFDPDAGTISAVSPPIADTGLTTAPAYVMRMLVLPTGQVLFSDGGRQLWVYTPDGGPNPALRPVINQVAYNSGGVFTLTGKQINGQSAGSNYGDDVATDENYPIVRFINSFGTVYYARTSNWSTTGVDGGSALQTVDFTLKPTMPAGNYSLVVSGAGISSFPIFVNITQGEVNGQ